MPNMEQVSIEELEYLAELFADQMQREVGNKPGYRIINMGKLQSSLTLPFQVIEDNELYPTLIDKASILYYLCIKNHPFEDGNKRMGIFSLLLFLFKNGYWINSSNQQLFNITVHTASSKTDEMYSVLNEIQKFIQENLVKID